MKTLGVKNGTQKPSAAKGLNHSYIFVCIADFPQRGYYIKDRLWTQIHSIFVIHNQKVLHMY